MAPVGESKQQFFALDKKASAVGQMVRCTTRMMTAKADVHNSSMETEAVKATYVQLPAEFLHVPFGNSQNEKPRHTLGIRDARPDQCINKGEQRLDSIGGRVGSETIKGFPFDSCASLPEMEEISFCVDVLNQRFPMQEFTVRFGHDETTHENALSLASLTLKKSWDDFRTWAQEQANACFSGQPQTALKEPVLIHAPFGHDPSLCIQAENAEVELRLDEEEDSEFGQTPSMLADITLRGFLYCKTKKSARSPSNGTNKSFSFDSLPELAEISFCVDVLNPRFPVQEFTVQFKHDETTHQNAPSMADLTSKRSWDQFRTWAQVQVNACFSGGSPTTLKEPVLLHAPFGNDPNLCLQAEHADVELRLDEEEDSEFCQTPNMLADITFRGIRYCKKKSSQRHHSSGRRRRGTPQKKCWQKMECIEEETGSEECFTEETVSEESIEEESVSEESIEEESM